MHSDSTRPTSTAHRTAVRLRALLRPAAFFALFALLAPLAANAAPETNQEAASPVLRIYTDYV